MSDVSDVRSKVSDGVLYKGTFFHVDSQIMILQLLEYSFMSTLVILEMFGCNEDIIPGCGPAVGALFQE